MSAFREHPDKHSYFVKMENFLARPCHLSSALGGGFSAGVTNLWHSERFPWQAAFTAVPIFFFFARPTSSYCEDIYIYIYIYIYIWLFEMLVGVLTACHTQL